MCSTAVHAAVRQTGRETAEGESYAPDQGAPASGGRTIILKQPLKLHLP